MNEPRQPLPDGFATRFHRLFGHSYRRRAAVRDVAKPEAERRVGKFAAAWALLAGLALPGIAQAQVVGTYGVWSGASLEPPPVYTGRPDEFANPGRGESGLPIDNWLVYPSAAAGAVYDSNPSHMTGGSGSPGLGLRINVNAENDDGINKTVVYTNTNYQYYTNQSALQNSGTGGNQVFTQTGAIETYQPLPDLIFNAQGDFSRQQDIFNALATNSNVTNLNPTGNGIAPTNNALSYNQYSGFVSAQKNFSDSFAILSGSIVDLVYDQSANVVAPSPNGITYTGTLGGGIWIAPDLYGYVAGSLDQRNYTNTTLNSAGYRMVAGVGSDGVGLFRGQLYAGYQAENYYNAPGVGTAGTPVFGGSGSYFPLPELTLSASINETLGASSAVTTASSPAGTSTKVTSFLAQATYALAQEWTASADAGYIQTTYGGTNSLEKAWAFGATATYSVWRRFGLTFEYQYTDVVSNVSGQGYSDNLLTVGLSYNY